jgi:hypothetical protein
MEYLHANAILDGTVSDFPLPLRPSMQPAHHIQTVPRAIRRLAWENLEHPPNPYQEPFESPEIKEFPESTPQDLQRIV